MLTEVKLLNFKTFLKIKKYPILVDHLENHATHFRKSKTPHKNYERKGKIEKNIQ